MSDKPDFLHALKVINRSIANFTPEESINLRPDILDIIGEFDSENPLSMLYFGEAYYLAVATKAIKEKYRQGGSGLGRQTSDVTKSEAYGYIQTYENGIIAYTPDSGAHVVQGEIYKKYVALGREKGVLGYPLTDQRKTPDEKGFFNRFQKGMIYWTISTGAHEIHGRILSLWESMGYETSYLGYPITDERAFPDTNGGVYNDFERGSIYFSRNTGAIDLPNEKTFQSQYITFSEGTALGGWCKIVINRHGDITFTGSMHNSGLSTLEFAAVAAMITPSGIAYTASYSGRTEGTLTTPFGTPRRDDDWIRSTVNFQIKENWIEIARATTIFTIASQDKLLGGIEDVVQDALKDLAKEGIKLGVKSLIALIF